MICLTRLVIGLPILFLIGCAFETGKPATEVYVHTPYKPDIDVPEKIVINKPFEDAWNNVVEKLAINFFTVEQIDKDSRFISINASRDASRGAGEGWWLEYVSCGSSSRTITHKNKTKIYSYETVGEKAYSHVLLDKKNSWYYWYNIAPRVVPRIKMNIYMSPIDANQTEMSVNARYEIDRTITGKRYTLRDNGNYLFDGDIQPNTLSIALTSRNPGEYPAKVTPSIFCYSTGEFESAVLDLAE